MYIILEGIDKVGKSSLARHINELLGLEIVKFSAPEGDPYIQYMSFLCERKTPAILDRFYLGERVYGPIKRGKSELNEWQTRNIEQLLLMRMPLCIYAYTNPKEIAKNFKKDGEIYLQENDINPILSNYASEIAKSSLKWHQYNYLEDKNYEKIDKIILLWYKYYLYNSTHLIDLIDNRTLGKYNSRTLVMGEVSNIALEQDKYKSINVGFANGPSAEILYGSLPSKGKNIALTNFKKAHLDNGPGNIIAELLLPNLRRVVCLGKESYKLTQEYCQARGIKHLQIMLAFHPAYIARGGATLKEYEMQLKELII